MTVDKIVMPQLGESVIEGTISTWLVEIGDKVEKYQPIAEVMTDKVNTEIPAYHTGEITAFHAEEGETVAVGEAIYSIEVDGKGTKEQQNLEANSKQEDQKETIDSQSMKTRYSPAVMRLAQEHQINLSEVNGSGRGGRITRKDIEKLISEESQKPKDELLTTPVSENKSTNTEPKKKAFTQSLPGDREIPVTGIRKAVATNMVRATTEIPHAWMMIEVDVTNLVNYRNAEKDHFKNNEGYNLSYFAFFLNAVAKALKKFPQLNSSWAGNKIIQHKEINLSIAVGNEQELFVPVLRNVDEKSIKGIAKEVHILANKARNGNLTQEDMSGGTFTVNNTGTFGSVQSMGVINYPQAAILQVESIVKRPVIINDMFAARDMVNLCLSLDHRILDGVICGKFMSHVKEILENISGDTTPIY